MLKLLKYSREIDSKVARGIMFSFFNSPAVEIWFAPSWFYVPPHTHPGQTTKLILLFGHHATAYVNGHPYEARWFDSGRCLTLNSNDVHYFTTKRWPLIFMQMHTNKHSLSENINYI